MCTTGLICPAIAFAGVVHHLWLCPSVSASAMISEPWDEGVMWMPHLELNPNSLYFFEL